MSKITEAFERIAALEEMVGIGHNGGPTFDQPPRPQLTKPDGLLPDRAVADRYGVSTRTLARWDKSDLNSPPPIIIRGRRYRSPPALAAWDRANARRVADPHSPHRDCAQALPRAQRGRFAKPATSKCADHRVRRASAGVEGGHLTVGKETTPHAPTPGPSQRRNCNAHTI